MGAYCGGGALLAVDASTATWQPVAQITVPAAPTRRRAGCCRHAPITLMLARQIDRWNAKRSGLS
jgi:hypothetical protein